MPVLLTIIAWLGGIAIALTLIALVIVLAAFIVGAFLTRREEFHAEDWPDPVDLHAEQACAHLSPDDDLLPWEKN